MKSSDLLALNGAVSKLLDNFESRHQQLEMAAACERALENRRLLLVEAGTGVGKSFAYLIPAVLWAIATGERVIVSTNTINLQEQLIEKDIPFLQQLEGLDFKAFLAKGRGNYICLRRLYSSILGRSGKDCGNSLQGCVKRSATFPLGAWVTHSALRTVAS